MKPSDIDANESVAQGSSGPLPLRYLQRYGLAILSVGLALGTSLLLEQFHFRDAGFPLLLFAVAISSRYGGPGPAVLAVILSTVGFYWFFVEPVRTIYIYRSEVPYFISFAAFAVLISWSSRLRRRVEEELRERAALLDLAHDTVLVMDLAGVIRYWNQGAAKRYGWTAEQAVGRVVHDLLKTVFPVPLEQIKAEVMRTGRWEGELVHTRKDGGQVVVASRWALQRGKRGAPVTILETNTDITERKRADEALRQSEAYLAETQRLSHTGSWAFDLASDEYVYTSEQCRRIFELDAQKGLPNREAVSQHIHPDDWDRVSGDYEKTLREKVDTSSEFRIVLPSGTAKHIQAIRHPVLNDAGDVVKVVGTAVDVTERKRAETALREMRVELERVSRATTIGALAASIAHEVNQPLAGVVTSANAGLNWLAANPPNLSKAREALMRVRRDGTRAGEVLARIRGLLRQAPSTKTLVNVNRVVRDVLALTAGKLHGDNIETALALDASLPAVLGDTIQLQQVLLNLVTNAIEAMAAVANRPRTLRIESSRGELEGKPAVVVAVSDTGIGLGSTDATRIFEAFHTTKPQGMGMGLWISRSIIEEHGGRLTAQANSGQGATFTLTIPTGPEADA